VASEFGYLSWLPVYTGLRKLAQNWQGKSNNESILHIAWVVGVRGAASTFGATLELNTGFVSLGFPRENIDFQLTTVDFEPEVIATPFRNGDEGGVEVFSALGNGKVVATADVRDFPFDRLGLASAQENCCFVTVG